MKKHLLLLLSFVITSYLLHAQNDIANLLAQSPDGKTVKLVWMLKGVPAGFSGFDIKRKEGLGEWKKLNKAPILPGISVKKSLSDVEPEATEVVRIKEKLKDLINAGSLREYTYAGFMSRWERHEKEIQDITLLASLDFDVSIMCGLGYVDRTVTQKAIYQYGLFSHNNDKLLARAAWNYGKIPNLDVITAITSKSTAGKNGIQLIWDVDVDQMKSEYVAGFNVYKHGIRLNDQPISAGNISDPSEFTWYDATAKPSATDQYSISAQSVFGIEGIITPYTYEPAEHPSDYKKATVTSVSSQGFYFKDGMSVKWAFPKEYEQYIRGFYIEKDNMPAGYNRVSELLPPDWRFYSDESPSTVNSYIRVRVLAVYNDKTIVNGVEKLYNYFPMVEPPKPQNVKVTGSAENKKYTVKISWDPPISGDSMSHYYRVYMHGIDATKYTAIADKLPLKPSSFTYTFQPGVSNTYQFCIAGLTKNGVEGIRSDTVSVLVPTTELPIPLMRKSYSDGKKAIVYWEYPFVQDLAGFRLYIDDNMIADEKTLNKHTREFTTEELQPGSANNFTVRAITEQGVISEPSNVATVTIATRRR